MRSYLVGGAVRDALLGQPVTDRDYVGVGARAEELLALGFRPVGKDFPVFLHPQTGEQYALARTERKCGPGYHGFQIDAAPEVTLEEDLARRDLTINAIARDEQGQLIDPYGGIDDLNRRLLRHVSPAFVEDPVRLLRLARFNARFAPLGFKVAPQTMALLQTMVAAGEIDHLVPERVWAETRKALGEAQPSAFFALLRQADALIRLFPELETAFAADSISNAQTSELIDAAAAFTAGDDLIVYAVLGHKLHAEVLQQLSRRLRVPNEYAGLAESVRGWHRQVQEAARLSPAALLSLLEALDGLRRPARLQRFLTACRCLRTNPAAPYPQTELLQQAATTARSVTADDFVAQGLQGPAIGAAMRAAQLAAITALRQSLPPDTP